jgi:tetratricopeptide (TPR) repeat protein
MDGVRAKAKGADAFAETAGDGDRVDDRVDDRDADGDVARELADARPAVDPIELARAQAKVARELFDTPLTSGGVGKYELDEKIGEGGMGTVYRGRDPQLGRAVALKLMRTEYVGDARSRERMLREAQTLAALDHPAIVGILEIVDLGEQVAMVMPLVDGENLAVWAQKDRRSWREIVDAYAQAGDGLAAAHAQGVIHRDFKPGNAMISGGKVKVLDFGLARREGEPAHGPAASAASPPLGAEPTVRSDAHARARAAAPRSPRMTETGAVLGTPGYWSPEQLAGKQASALSDQYSFCVALHVALEGKLPFEADSWEKELAYKETHVIARATDGRVVPGWLRAVVARGLSPRPADRFPSMSALVAELRRPRGWRRWRTATVLGASTLAAAAITSYAVERASAIAPCDGGADLVAPAWNLARRIQLAATLAAVPGPALAASRDKILASLDDYRARWQSIHRDGCVAKRKGGDSDRMTDRRAACLQQRLADLRATVDVLARTDRSTAVNAQATVGKLASLDTCADAAYLTTDGPPPPAPAQRSSVDAIRARLAEARALDHAGRSDDAKALAAIADADAERIGYAPVIAEASLLHGRILLARNESAAAVAPLARARTAAFEAHMYPLVVEAAARKLFVEAQLEDRTADLLREAATFEEMSRGLAGDHYARPLLLNNIANIYQSDGDPEAAARQLEAAHAELVDVPAPDIELSAIDVNLGILTADPVRRVALLQAAWERRRVVLDEHHLSTLEALDALARHQPDTEAAFAHMTTLAAAYAADHPTLIEQRARVASYRGFLAEQLGLRDEALAIYRELARLIPADRNDLAFWRELATGHARRLAGDAAGAVEAFMPVAEEFRASTHWWMHPRAGDAELGIGLAELDRGRPDAARPHFEAAARIYAEAIAHSHRHEFALRAELAGSHLE